MRATHYILSTLKETPKNCEIISHQLMIKAGMIRQISSGLYTWLPTGLRVLKKIEKIIRREMDKIGFLEILMPITQPAKLWKQSGRWLEYGPELLRFTNRTNQQFVLGPTHEEMIANLICQEIGSLKQFPLKLYQIYTKYRDEIRPQFGLIRTKEFIMKDGYSFHTNQKSLQNTYNDVYDTYHTIFNQIKLNFQVIQVDPGNTGGTVSHEFQSFYKKDKKEKHSIILPTTNTNRLTNLKINKNDHYISDNNTKKKYPLIYTKKMRLVNIDSDPCKSELLKKCKLPLYKFMKIITVQAQNTNSLYNFLGLIIRADHQLSYSKISIIPEIKFPLSILEKKYIEKIIKSKLTLLNLIHLSIPIIIDYHVAIMNNFIIESNINAKNFLGINWNKDLSTPKIADLHETKYKNQNVKKIINNKELTIQNNIEIGHIFQLGKKYSNSIYNCIQKYDKQHLTMIMGCYGIGITRIIPAVVEQNYDKYGIVWPDIIAPFKIAIIPINLYQSTNVKNITEKLYKQLVSMIGSEVFFDDRPERPGVMFTDIDLIGIPHILIISDKNLNNQEIEYKYRKTGKIKKIKLAETLDFLTEKLINY